MIYLSEKDTMWLSTAYLGNIQYYTKLLSGEAVIDLYEHYQKQSYRNRCEILTANGRDSLIIPVLEPSGVKTPTREIRIDNSKQRWQHQHFQALLSAYRNSPYFYHYEEQLLPFYTKPYRYLVEWNQELQQTILRLLGVEPTIRYSLRYGEEIAPERDFRDSISPKERLHRSDSSFKELPYFQVFSDRHPFQSNLSILDLLFCQGPNALEVIRQSSTLSCTME